MSVEKSPDSMNKRHYAFGMLPLTLSVSGWVNVAGLGWQVIQLMLALTLFMFSGNAMANNREHQQIALVGTWTHIPDAPAVQKPAFPSEGLYRLRVNVDGTLTLLNVIKMKSPSWIVKSRDGRFAYVTNEEDAGTVTALAIDDAGSVRVLNTVSSAGRQPTHATLSPDGKFLFVANYSVANGGAGVTVLPIRSDGTLGERVQHYPFIPGSGIVQGRQEGGHAHSTTFSRDGQYLYAADLGGDKLHAYRYRPDNAQPLQADASRDVGFAPGAGPRHMVFSPEGEYAYVITEMAGEIEAFAVSDHRLTRQGKVKLNGGLDSAEAKSGGAIILSPSGRYLIATHRGTDNHLLVFKIGRDGLPGVPTRYEAGGIEPRALAFDADGNRLYVTNVFTNSVTLFDFDDEKGELQARGEAAAISMPTDIKFFN
ncbi:MULTISPECIES: lactonase family protein [Serratia]|uniref:lactonase family protein n=1 Tax=Serratia TaxID=613 RepID=UPI002240C1DF|nr:lactonase family protein [Serratia bockelmannii]BEN07510.1 6-phosphogluconolactonase [Serratia marcescens]MCW7648510.1 lactonase family protein [Serratia bockelmannii]MCW7658295.1 lactonase family protein [Serratia bockelmannii]MCW7678079.1 lactonase family protein [Serratia bockelmannii]MCW7682856.1 lactonase family protein [Serratia bockelmannii]